MTFALARLPYASLTAASVAIVIFVTALGSSSVAPLARFGGPGRWVALAVLLVVAAAWSLARRRSLHLPVPAVVGAVWFVALCAVSGAWSVRWDVTVERAVSLGALIAAVGFAAAAAAAAGAAHLLLDGVLVGAAAVALAGLPLLAFDYGAAVRSASVGVPARYQGIGQSPNTVALLLALAVPLAVWVALTGRRVVGLALVLLFGASLAASASRGGIVGAAAGSAVVVLLYGRSVRRATTLLAVVTAAAAAAVSVGTFAHGRSAGATSSAPPAPSAKQAAPSRYVNVEKVFPLEDDIGRPLPGRGDNEGARTLLGSSGRRAVWSHVISQVLTRPVAGFGFGTEEYVFQDRYANFEGGHVENSYLGLVLQLGFVGLAAFLGVVGVVLAAGRKTLRAGGVATAATGALAGGLVAALVQSYVYSAGNIATLTFWLSLAMVAAAAAREAR